MTEDCRRFIRVSLAVAIGGLAAGFAFFLSLHYPNWRPDLFQPWFGAQSILLAVDPYPLVGPGRAVEHEFRFLYPLTSSIAILPLGLLSLHAATAIFLGLSAGLLAFAITRDGWYRLPLFLSIPFIAAFWGAQWSPILSAAFMIPSLSFLYVAKPSIGLALLAANGSRQALFSALIGGSIILLLSLIAVPTWPLEWLQALRGASQTLPLLRPGGFVALFALFRWRQPEARLVTFLSLIPQTALWYEALPLLLVARNFRESLFLTIATSAPVLWEGYFGLSDGAFDVYPRGFQLALFAYLPCVVMVLLRPNEGELPAWMRLLRRRVQSIPTATST